MSLMQMAKTSAALHHFQQQKLLYAVVHTDPTMAGVSASYAMLGDVHIAEPGALIGFAGPRVIEQTIRQKLPKGFQRSEYLMDHGFVDLEPFTTHVIPEKCGACHTCEGLCPYGAINIVELDGKMVAHINEVLCKGCGACAAACPAGAVVQDGFTDDQILSEIEGISLLEQV